VLALALLLAPRMPVAIAMFAAVAGVSGLALAEGVERLVADTSLAGRPLAGPPGVVLDWVDSVVPDGERAALLPFPLSTDWGVSAIAWWDVEFWNTSATQSYVAADGNFDYAPFPHRVLEIDPVTGVLRGTADAPRYVVASAGDTRFGLAGSRHAANVDLVVVDAERPYRALWSTRGVRTDGWTRAMTPAVVRLHAQPERPPEVVEARIRVIAPAEGGARYHVAAETVSRPGALDAGGATDEIVLVCVPRDRPADVRITATTSVRAPGPPLQPTPAPSRLVGVRVGPVVLRDTGQPCDG
jgi:hypothetical protein